MISNHSSNCGEKYVPETACVMWLVSVMLGSEAAYIGNDMIFVKPRLLSPDLETYSLHTSMYVVNANIARLSECCR